MRIYRERIPEIASSIVEALLQEELVEIDPELRREAELDVESVLHEYRRTDRELSEQARDIVAEQGLDYSNTNKIKNQLAARRNFKVGDEAVDWITNQMLEILLQSKNVEEVFGEDAELRRVITPVFKRELEVESELDREVRKRIKNLEEGTTDFDVEYQKTLERVRKAKGLTE